MEKRQYVLSWTLLGLYCFIVGGAYFFFSPSVNLVVAGHLLAAVLCCLQLIRPTIAGWAGVLLLSLAYSVTGLVSLISAMTRKEPGSAGGAIYVALFILLTIGIWRLKPAKTAAVVPPATPNP